MIRALYSVSRISLVSSGFSRKCSVIYILSSYSRIVANPREPTWEKTLKDWTESAIKYFAYYNAILAWNIT